MSEIVLALRCAIVLAVVPAYAAALIFIWERYFDGDTDANNLLFAIVYVFGGIPLYIGTAVLVFGDKA